MDATGLWASTRPLLISFGLKLLGAIAIVVIGRWVIRFISKMISKAMERQKVEPTIVRYLSNTLTVGLNVLLFIGILGFFGVETTSFAALIAALGIAIGAAWGVLAVRPYVHNDHYWQVYFDTNRVIRDTFGTAGYPVPEAHVQLRQLKAA